MADAARRISAGVSRLAATGHEVRQVAYKAAPEWLTLSIVAAFTEWAEGEAATCQHRPTVAQPEPVFAAAWMPGLIVCAQCTDRLALPAGSVRDRTCDACGHICAGPAHADPIWAKTVVAGLLVYQIGVCRDCLPWRAS
ncbi:hypothetical protein ACQEVB_11660 [Pseudonocardia sp. CA-107938]|uniref:hypothetical protein n=1 Tax=Pseudonocardia sp. CA-107938 TaxID=3240021 RepID=UPI003D8A666D